MARLSKFRSDDARTAYLRLYDAALSASSVQITESDVETSFGITHVLHAGDRSKPSLVALHGSSISSTMWVPLLDTLTAGHSVTMIDAIDEAGKSIAAKPTTTITDIVTWIDETMRALDIQRASFVAASRGMWIAAHYAAAFPEKVERLALLCPVGIARGMSPSFMVRGLAPLVLPLKERHVWRVLETMVVPQNRTLLHQQPWMPSMRQFIYGAMNFKMSLGNPQPRPWPLRSDCDLDRLMAIPVLAVIGRDESALNGPKAAIMLRESLPDARIEVVDDANHMVNVDQTATVQKLLVEFLGDAN